MSKVLTKFANDISIRESHDFMSPGFNSSLTKFYKSHFEPKEGPGPGNYDVDTQSKGFPHNTAKKDNESVIKERDGKKADQEMYKTTKSICYSEPEITRRKSANKCPFNSQRQRFEYQIPSYTKKLAIPGPGHYKEEKACLKPLYNKKSSFFISRVRRFSSAGVNLIGPGSYNNDAKLIKDSFNMTIGSWGFDSLGKKKIDID
jgi:hypothetical protein